MGFLKNLARELPGAVLDLIPGGEILGAVARAVTNTDDDQAAEIRLEANPELQVEYQKALLAHMAEQGRSEVARLEAENARLAEINRTMRSEAASEHWLVYTWRPVIGYCFGASLLGVTLAVLVLGYQALGMGKPEALGMIPQLLTAIAPLYAAFAGVLGIASWHRGKEKRVKAGELSADLVTALGAGALGDTGKTLISRVSRAIGGSE